MARPIKEFYQRAVRNFDAATKEDMSRDFDTLLAQPREHWEILTQAGIDKTLELDADFSRLVANAIKIDVDDAERALDALAFLLSDLRWGKSDFKVLTEVLQDEGIVSSERAKVLLDFTGHLGQAAGHIRKEFEEHDLASRVLPAYRSAEVTVDVRLQFQDSSVQTVVPVALLRVDTDAPDRYLWLQLTAKQIDLLVEKLTLAKAEMQQARTWIADRNQK